MSHAHLGRQTLTVRWDPQIASLASILGQIDRLGYTATLLTDESAFQARKKERRQLIKRIGVAALGTMQVMMVATALYVGEASFIDADQRHFLRWISLVMSIPVMLYAAQPFFVGAWRNLRHRNLGMDVPVALALSLAWIASIIATISELGEVYFDSVAMFTLFLLTGRFLELKARHQVLDTPVESRPMPMTLAKSCGDGQFEQTPVSMLRPGDLIQLAAGQQTPVDLTLISDRASVDTQALTGEFEPIVVERHAEILAGSINGSSVIEAKVLRVGKNAFLGRLEHLARQAETVELPEARWMDPLIRWFIASVLTLSIITFVFWWPTNPEQAFEYALSVLVVTCPCALSLAIPTAWTVTIRRLRRLGILLLNPTHLLAFARSNDWFFDKTGTLTEGRFQRLGVKQLGTTDMDQALSILSGLEQGTVHPIAKAFEDIVPTPLQQITHLAGQGVSGVLNGTQYRVRQSTLEEMNPEFEHALQITLETDEGALISVALDDALRPDAKHTIEALQAMNIRLTILSGDREDRVQAIAQSLQIDHALAQCRPEDKLRHLRHISASTVMVGDGLNDSPVLAAANGSITFAQAADLTRLSAGAILLSPELKSVLKLRETAQKTTQVIRQSLFWVLVYNAIAVPFAMSGWVPPWLAAIGMSASSLFVITNALRLNRIS
ncbi:MAG TPA: copper-translocating P-type ATPase [Gammaproteobacteria bacterium]|jgi:Cu2+-exporting ATPase|nr:copper-translocating P-type ATPase [Gammaproteobacteria bacterium]